MSVNLYKGKKNTKEVIRVEKEVTRSEKDTNAEKDFSMDEDSSNVEDEGLYRYSELEKSLQKIKKETE